MSTSIFIEPFKGYLIRTPHFPYSKLKEALINNSFRKEMVLRLLQNPVFMEAIYLSSKDLFYECIKIENADLENEKYLRIISTLLQYFIRISSRSTPFGLFAGIGYGSWGDRNEINIKRFKYSIMHDMESLEYYSESLKKNNHYIKRSQLYTNSTLYKVSNEYRYFAKSRTSKAYKLIKVNVNNLTKYIIEESSKGIGHTLLKKKLHSKNMSERRAERIINEAIENQLLHTNLNDNIYGTPYLEGEKSHFNTFKECKSVFKHISEVKISDYPYIPGNNIDDLQENSKRIKESTAKESHPASFYSNLMFDTNDATLDTGLIDTINNGINVLLRIYNNTSNSEYLKEFINKFLEKYDQKEIMLLKALDPEIGIQFDSESLNNYYFPINQSEFYQNANPREIHIKSLNGLLIKLINKSTLNNSIESEILDEDLHSKTSSDILPETFNVFFQILDLEKDKHKVFLKSISGPSANCLLGRFGKVNSDINDLIKDICVHESDVYKALLTEVEYNPGGKVANILKRNIHYPYITSLFTINNNMTQENIPLSDLFLSIRNNKIILRSSKFDSEVIPCNSTAHNYFNSQLGIYRFLSELQTYYMGESLSFSWGVLESIFTFLPRVIYKNIILSPAKWNFSSMDLKEIIEISESKDLQERTLKWRQKFNIPSKILISDFDNELLINLRNEESIRLFISIIRKRKEFSITEFLFDKSELVRSKDGIHMHEIIAPFKKIV